MQSEIYKALFQESFSVMLLIYPETGRIIDANNAACKYYGYSGDDLKQMTIQDINTLSQEDVYAEMQQAISEKRNYFNFLHRLASGEIREVEVFSGPIVVNNEKVLYSIVHDISERRRIAKQVEMERKFSESLINSLPGIMYVFDEKGTFIRWNRNFELLSGCPGDRIRKMHPLDFISPESRNLVREAIQKVFRKGFSSVEAGFLTCNGSAIPYLLTGYKLNQMDSQYLVGIGVDISARVAAENEKERLIVQLRKSLDKVKQLSGFLPICAFCKKIRDDKGYWKQVESYIEEHSEAHFSHGLCTECADKLYGDKDWYKNKK